MRNLRNRSVSQIVEIKAAAALFAVQVTLLAELVVALVLEEALLGAEYAIAHGALLGRLLVTLQAVEFAHFAREELLIVDDLLARVARDVAHFHERAYLAIVKLARARFALLGKRELLLWQF